MKRSIMESAGVQQKQEDQHLIDAAGKRRRLLEPLLFRRGIHHNSRYDDEATLSNRDQFDMNENNGTLGATMLSGVYDAEEYVYRYMQPSTEHIIAHAEQYDSLPPFDTAYHNTQLSRATLNVPGKEPRQSKIFLVPPAPNQANRSLSDGLSPSTASPLTNSESQVSKMITKSREVKKLAAAFEKLNQYREAAVNLRVRGQVLRKGLQIYRAQADNISVKLQELLMNEDTPRQTLLDAIEELRNARVITISLEVDYNDHEAQVNAKEYELAEWEQRFSDKYNPKELEFADDLELGSVESNTDDDGESGFSSSDDEFDENGKDPTTGSPTIPRSLNTRDKYVDKVEELGDLVAQREKVRVEQDVLQGLRIQRENLRHDRSRQEIAVARERLDTNTNGELSSKNSKALDILREQERALAARIKAAEAESSRLEIVAVAAGEMPPSAPLSPTVDKDEVADGETIILDKTQLDRHPLLFPFPNIDMSLHINEPSGEFVLPVGVNDWSLYRLRSNHLDVDLYRANSEPGMWSKPSLSLESQNQLDRQLTKQILEKWQMEPPKRNRRVKTSEMSEDVLKRVAATEVDESLESRANPRLDELLRRRRLPYPRRADEITLPFWDGYRSAPEPDSFSRRDYLLHSR